MNRSAVLSRADEIILSLARMVQIFRNLEEKVPKSLSIPLRKSCTLVVGMKHC